MGMTRARTWRRVGLVLGVFLAMVAVETTVTQHLPAWIKAFLQPVFGMGVWVVLLALVARWIPKDTDGVHREPRVVDPLGVDRPTRRSARAATAAVAFLAVGCLLVLGVGLAAAEELARRGLGDPEQDGPRWFQVAVPVVVIGFGATGVVLCVLLAVRLWQAVARLPAGQVPRWHATMVGSRRNMVVLEARRVDAAPEARQVLLGQQGFTFLTMTLGDEVVIDGDPRPFTWVAVTGADGVTRWQATNLRQPGHGLIRAVR